MQVLFKGDSFESTNQLANQKKKKKLLAIYSFQYLFTAVMARPKLHCSVLTSLCRDWCPLTSYQCEIVSRPHGRQSPGQSGWICGLCL